VALYRDFEHVWQADEMIGVRARRACNWHLEPPLGVAFAATLLLERGRAAR
jgi:hypothetical protein